MIKLRDKITIFALFGLLIIGMGLFNTAKAVEPLISVSPSSADKKVNDVFDILVRVNPNEEKVCVVEGKLNLNKLSCQKVTMGSGLSAQTSPLCGDLSFVLGIQKCATSEKTLFTVSVKANSAGAATADFSGVDIIGEGVSLSSNSSGASYAITSVPVCDCSAWGFWENGNCGAGTCSSEQRIQTRARTCTPSECDVQNQTQCIDDSDCVVVSLPQEGEELEGPEIEEVKGEKIKDTEQEIEDTEQISEESGAEPQDFMSADIAGKDIKARKGVLGTMGFVWDEITNSALMVAILTSCFWLLTFIGFRRWILFRYKN